MVRALVLLWNDTARVVEPDEYRLYAGPTGPSSSPERQPMHPVGPLRLRVPEVICLAHYDRLPGDGGDVQPAQRGQAGPLHLPVLRSAARRRVDHDRPRRAALAGGRVELDELRRRLRPLQRPQGRPHARAGRHAASAPAGPARVEAVLRGAGVRVESWARFLTHEPALLHA